jgi:hypothetical protein
MAYAKIPELSCGAKVIDRAGVGMNKITPLFQSTKNGVDSHEWIPTSFENFLLELGHITKACSGNNPLPLFRGHADSAWLLDSTFVRTCKKRLFDVPAHSKITDSIRDSVVYHMALLNLLLLKFSILAQPGQELKRLECEHGIDAWFELLRKCQQYPEDDHPQFKGTFVLDWTKSHDVALFFANKDRTGDGAIWVCDAVATGKTLQTMKVESILDLMHEKGNAGNSLGVPLIFYPTKQIKQERANNQQAVYLAQMELRYDFAEMWAAQEKKDEYIFVKLILPAGTQEDCSEYLLKKGITETWIFPD